MGGEQILIQLLGKERYGVHECEIRVTDTRIFCQLKLSTGTCVSETHRAALETALNDLVGPPGLRVESLARGSFIVTCTCSPAIFDRLVDAFSRLDHFYGMPVLERPRLIDVRIAVSCSAGALSRLSAARDALGLDIASARRLTAEESEQLSQPRVIEAGGDRRGFPASSSSCRSTRRPSATCASTVP